MAELTEQEIAMFTLSGQNSMTTLAQGGEQLLKWSASFEQRGGGEVHGEDALAIVYLSNDFQEWLTPERAATIARLRTDV